MCVYVCGHAHSWAQLSNSLLQYCQHANITLHNLFALQMAISIATNACIAIYRWQLDAALMRFGVRRSHQKLLLSEEHRRTDPHEQACFFASLHLNSPPRQATVCNGQSCHVRTAESQNEGSCLDASLPRWSNTLKDNVSLWKNIPSYHTFISKASSRKFLNLTKWISNDYNTYLSNKLNKVEFRIIF